MGIVKEPLNVDFVVENRPLTKDEEKQISEYISSQKIKKELKDKTIKRTIKTKQLTQSKNT
jgi:hypothetical protein